MLFITNRLPNEGPTPTTQNPNQPLGVPRPISFNLQDNRVDQSVYFCRREANNRFTEIGSPVFFNELKTANVKELLFYLHGFRNTPDVSFERTIELQRFCDQKAPNTVRVIPLIWPCNLPADGAGIIKDYFDDEMIADKSGLAFARLLQKFLAWRETNSTLDHPCLKRMNLLAHSMGNRVLRSAFTDTVKYFLPQGIPLIFRNIFMVAADIVNESLEDGKEGQYIPPTARNVVVYYASDDMAMRASKVANVGQAVVSRRLGHTGPEDMAKVARNVYAIDCDDFNNEYDAQSGHGYFGGDRSGNPGVLFDHLWRCIDTGRVPMQTPNTRVTILNRSWLR